MYVLLGVHLIETIAQASVHPEWAAGIRREDHVGTIRVLVLLVLHGIVDRAVNIIIHSEAIFHEESCELARTEMLDVCVLAMQLVIHI